MKLSLMTINMMFPIYMKVMVEQDMEDALELYEEMLDLVKASGFDTVDVTSAELDFFGIDFAKNELKKRNLKVSSLIHFGQFASMNDREAEEITEKAKKAVDFTLGFGANVLMLVPQAQENITDYSREELADSLVCHWWPVAQYAKEKGVHPVIEDTPDLRIPLCTTEELSYVLDRIPDMELVYDSGNMVLVNEDPITYFDTFASRTGHIHLKDMMLTDASNMFADTAKDGRKMTAAPSGKGLLDFETLIRHIRDSGYEGYLTVEYAKGDDEEYLESLIRSREYFEELLQRK